MAIRRRDTTYKYHSKGDVYTTFEIANEENAAVSYYGYLNEDASWIIQRRTTATGVYDYVMGYKDYATAWTGRAGLTYVSYSEL